jgi:hypothetical protein
MKKTHEVLVLLSALFASTFFFNFDSPAFSAELYTISGFVGNSSTSAASRVNVVLYSKDTEKNVDSVQTNFFGKYTFKDVAPGTYLVKVGKISQEVVVVKKNLRIDIDLSAEAA